MKTLIVFLLSIVGIAALISGALLIIDPTGIMIGLPAQALDYAVFHNFLLPGIILLIIIGGTSGLALFYLFKSRTKGASWSIIAGAVLCSWLIAQSYLYHAFSRLQPLLFTVGVFIVLLGAKYKRTQTS